MLTDFSDCFIPVGLKVFAPFAESFCVVFSKILAVAKLETRIVHGLHVATWGRELSVRENVAIYKGARPGTLERSRPSNAMVEYSPLVLDSLVQLIEIQV